MKVIELKCFVGKRKHLVPDALIYFKPMQIFEDG